MSRLAAPAWHDSEMGQLTKNDLIEQVGIVAVLRGAAAFLRMTHNYRPSFCAKKKAEDDIRRLSGDNPIHEDAVRAIFNRYRLSNLTR